MADPSWKLDLNACMYAWVNSGMAAAGTPSRRKLSALAAEAGKSVARDVVLLHRVLHLLECLDARFSAEES
jgi:hypothetical protein